MKFAIPFRNSLFQVYKSTTTYKKNICRVYLHYQEILLQACDTENS